MGVIETVILLSLYVYDGGNKTIEGWYHQENLSACLKGKRIAERNACLLYTSPSPRDS